MWTYYKTIVHVIINQWKINEFFKTFKRIMQHSQGEFFRSLNIQLAFHAHNALYTSLYGYNSMVLYSHCDIFHSEGIGFTTISINKTPFEKRSAIYREYSPLVYKNENNDMDVSFIFYCHDHRTMNIYYYYYFILPLNWCRATYFDTLFSTI